MYKAIIFDLDGTLLNTIADLCDAANYALAYYGYPSITLDQARRYIGNGVKMFIMRALSPIGDEKTINDALAVFKKYYSEHINVKTVPYEGIKETMKALKDAGIKVYVNSNKYHSALNSLCEAHFEGFYDHALGESEETPKKPDPTGANRLIKMSGADKSEVIYIGDSDSDIKTAANAGIDCGWVSWGFRTREEMEGHLPEITFDTAKQITDFILNK